MRFNRKVKIYVDEKGDYSRHFGFREVSLFIILYPFLPFIMIGCLIAEKLTGYIKEVQLIQYHRLMVLQLRNEEKKYYEQFRFLEGEK